MDSCSSGTGPSQASANRRTRMVQKGVEPQGKCPPSSKWHAELGRKVPALADLLACFRVASRHVASRCPQAKSIC